MRSGLSVFLLIIMLAGCAGKESETPRAPRGDYMAVQQPFVAAVERAVPAVVNIRTVTRFAKGTAGGGGRGFAPEYLVDMLEDNGGFRENSLGSGVIIGEDGLIVTNEHVVRDADEIVVRLSDRSEYRAKVIGADVRTDLAVLRIHAQKKLPVAALGDSSSLRVGEFAIAVGNPFGLESTVTVGVISATGRSAEPDVEGADEFIQTDASINPGNSGGPLLNLRGEVVGINTAMVSSGQGLGFAIPINIVKEVEQKLTRHGSVRRGWLGVSIQPLTNDLAEAFGAKGERGVLVNRVIPGSAAEAGGLRMGDILVAWDRTRINGVKEFRRMVAGATPGASAPIEVLRGGKRFTITLTLSEAEGRPQAPRPAQHESVDPIGLAAERVSPLILKELDLKGGVEVTFVEADSPAWNAGIREGDILIAINRETVQDIESYIKIIRGLPRGKIVPALISREGLAMFVGLRTK